MWLGHLRQDVRYALRTWGRNPGFCAAAIVTLALGIGANTAVFSVVNAVLVQPLPYAHPDRLVEIVENVSATETANHPPRRIPALSWGALASFRNETHTLSHVGVGATVRVTITTRDGPQRLLGFRLTPSLFTAFGVQPTLGRAFDEREETPGEDAVAILSHSAWHRYFGGTAGILGLRVVLDNRSHAIVGVMPARFQYPNPDTEIWLPLALPTSGAEAHTRSTVVARVKPDVSVAAAAEEVSAILSRSSEAMAPQPLIPGSGPRFELLSIHEQLVAPMRPTLRVLLVAVALILSIACVNVANLLLARATARQQEMAVRHALGAGRTRLVRQLLTESVLLAAAGGAAGGGLAYGAVHLLRRFGVSLSRADLAAGVAIPRLDEIAIDSSVLFFAACLSLATGLLFGLTPALQQSRADGANALRYTNLSRQRRSHGVLIVAEVSMAMILLVGAGLLIASSANLARVPRGYQPAGVLTFQVTSPRFAEDPGTFAEQLVERIRSIPGTRAAGYAGALPMVQVLGSVPLRATDRPSESRNLIPSSESRLPSDRPNPRYVSRDFLTVMGTRVIAGRGFDGRDRAGQPLVLLVNETLARSGVLGQNPIGKHVYVIGGRPWEVVGIVEDTRDLGLHLEPNPQVFMNFSQLPGSLGPDGIEHPYFAVRIDSNASPATLVSELRTLLRQIDPEALLDNVATMEQLLSHSVSRRRMLTLTLGAFAALAAALAAVGVCSVIGYSVGQRRREIGIRMALGARSAEIIRLVLGRSVAMTAAGIVLGLGGAAALTRYLESMLFGLTTLDAATFAAVSLVFATLAAVAAIGPVRRATKIDPLSAIRCE